MCCESCSLYVGADLHLHDFGEGLLYAAVVSTRCFAVTDLSTGRFRDARQSLQLYLFALSIETCT